MSWEKNSKKKPSILINFGFLINFIRHTGPMVTMGDQVCRWAISANSGLNKKPGILINFCFLVHFITKLNSNSKVCIDLLSPQKLKPPLVTLSQLELDTSDLSLVFPLET